MTERPLLIFPEPEQASRSGLSPGRMSAKCPSHGRQGERLGPKFDQLQRAAEARRMEVQQSPVGIDPDQVLVIETVGSVEDFAKAVKKIPGLEWMGEIEIDDIEPDDDFYIPSKPGKKLPGRLYLILSNQEALRNILSMWRRYLADPETPFDRGLKKFRDVLKLMKDIRRWGVQDRLMDTGVLEVWRENLERGGDEPIRFEAELWYRANENQQRQGLEYVRSLFQSSQGRIVSECNIPEISYHAILGELPRGIIQQIIDSVDTDLVKCESVMFFRPTGQVAAGKLPTEGDAQIRENLLKPLPDGYPLLAILDGLPIENHEALAGRLIVDDPDDWASLYPATERVHGTSMASLAVHGDYQANEPALRTPVYIRPIMQPNPNDWRTPREEVIPVDTLTVDLVCRAVRRMFIGDSGESAAAPSVKIINISIGDRCAPLDRTMSAWGRLLDWLSIRYNVLFVVSGGNHTSDIHLDLDEQTFDALTPDERSTLIIKTLHSIGRQRRILSPAEALNVITVGAIHADHAKISSQDGRVDPVLTQLPSPVTPLGFGYRRTIKPDLVHTGGRLMYRKSFRRSASGGLRLEASGMRSAPGCCAAHPGNDGGTSFFAFTSGTSNSAVLVSRNAVVCLERLRELLGDAIAVSDLQRFEIPMLKALLVHGCTWGQIGQQLRTVFTGVGNTAKETGILRQWLGYGTPDFSRSLECTDQRATVLGFGFLNDGEAHVFKLPLPPSMGARQEWRRLTVSLAWLSPTLPSSQKYRKASLWFDVDSEAWLKASRIAGDWKMVRKGTIQHEVFEGTRSVAISEGDCLSIQVNCREDAGPFSGAIAYGLVVSLEVAEGVQVPVYNEVRTRIAVPIPIPNQPGGIGV